MPKRMELAKPFERIWPSKPIKAGFGIPKEFSAPKEFSMPKEFKMPKVFRVPKGLSKQKLPEVSVKMFGVANPFAKKRRRKRRRR